MFYSRCGDAEPIGTDTDGWWALRENIKYAHCSITRFRYERWVTAPLPCPPFYPVADKADSLSGRLHPPPPTPTNPPSPPQLPFSSIAVFFKVFKHVKPCGALKRHSTTDLYLLSDLVPAYFNTLFDFVAMLVISSKGGSLKEKEFEDASCGSEIDASIQGGRRSALRSLGVSMLLCVRCKS